MSKNLGAKILETKDLGHGDLLVQTVTASTMIADFKCAGKVGRHILVVEKKVGTRQEWWSQLCKTGGEAGAARVVMDAGTLRSKVRQHGLLQPLC